MATVCQDIIYHRLRDNMWHELMKNHPLVMPQCQATRLGVSVTVGDRWILRSNEVHCMIMKQRQAACRPAIIMFSSLRGSPIIAALLVGSRGRSSYWPPLSIRNLIGSAASYNSGLTPCPPP